MGMRFRKSIGNKYLRVNLSKSGVGYSAGVKGARITKTAKGTTRTTVGIPGTGLGYVSETSNSSHSTPTVAANAAQQETKSGCLITTLLGIVLTIVLLPIKLLIAAVKSIFKSNKDG